MNQTGDGSVVCFLRMHANIHTDARRVVTGPIGSDHSHQEPAVEEAPLSGDQDSM